MDDLMNAFALMERGENEEALLLIKKNLMSCERDSEEYLSWMNTMGYAYCNLCDYGKALEVYNEYIDISQKKYGFEELHIGLHQKGMTLRLMKRYEDALTYFDREEEIIGQYFAGDDLKSAVNEYEQGYCRFLSGDSEEGLVRMHRSLEHALKTDDLIAQACAYRGLGEIFKAARHLDQANDCFDKACALFLKAGSDIGAEEVHQMRLK